MKVSEVWVELFCILVDWSIKEGWSRFFEKVGAGNLPKYMAKENTSQEFRLKEKKTKQEIIPLQNEWNSKKHKKVCKILNYTSFVSS